MALLEISLAGSFLAGVLSFLSPCVLPLVPPYLCFLAGISLNELAESRDIRPGQTLRILSMAAFFVLGFATVFVALGATASTVGSWVTEHFGILAILAGAIILVMGLHFLGWIRVPFLYRDIRVHATGKPAGFFGAYLVGLAFAFGWTPCVGPILATILLVAGAEATAARGALLLFAYALGIGLPFMLAALFAGPFLKFVARFRSYTPAIERAMGASLVVTGILFMTGVMPLIAGWLLQAVPALGTIG